MNRRRVASGAAIGLLSAPLLVEAPLPAQAESTKLGWQVKLPSTWIPFRQSGIPKLDDATARELLVGGDPSSQAEVKVARVPLATSPRDPQGLGGLALIEFFSTPKGQEPRVTQQQTVDILSKAFAQQPAIFSFALVGSPSASFQNTTKFLRYDFEAARCEGAQVQGVSGKVCQRSDNGEVLPVFNRRHTVLSTVVSEPTGDARVAEGMLLGPGGAEVLWVVDVSTPVASWNNLTEQVEALLGSFAVGTEAQLAATRDAAAQSKK